MVVSVDLRESDRPVLSVAQVTSAEPSIHLDPS